MRIHLLAGARPFEAAAKPLRFSFSGHGLANLTLPSLAALVPRHHEVVVQDEQVAPLDLDAPMDLALISAKCAYAPRAYEIAATLRARGVPVVMGGCHATLCPDEVAEHVDSVVMGEAEDLIQVLLEDVRTGQLRPRYRGRPADLSLVPPPRRDLLQKRYIVDSVHVSRGCSHSCSFCCMRDLYGRGYRTRPLGDVVQELEGLGTYLGFLDENLAADPDYSRALFKAMIPMGKRWLGQVSVDLLDYPDLIELAGAAGAQGFFFGMESVDQDTLYKVGKPHNQVSRYADLVRACHASGITVGAGMLFGLDEDRPEVFQNTLDTLLELEVDQGYFKLATPYPGTSFFRRMDADGRILSHDWALYDGCFPVYEPRHMGPRELFEGLRWTRRKFYNPCNTARRLSRFRRLNLPWWAQANMARLARNAYRPQERLAERFLQEIGA